MAARRQPPPNPGRVPHHTRPSAVSFVVRPEAGCLPERWKHLEITVVSASTRGDDDSGRFVSGAIGNKHPEPPLVRYAADVTAG
jgi:hypothetical protein